MQMAQQQHSGVQGKLACVFKIEVEQASSSKRSNQSYKVVATSTISPDAIASNIYQARATEKLDGTCCYICEFKGKISLWARLDRKPSKKVDKKFKQFQHSKRQWIMSGKYDCEPKFCWSYPEDLKPVPPSWICGLNVIVDSVSGHPIPDDNGHIPGWVPVETDPRQYCWHRSAVHHENQIALILKNKEPVSSLGKLESTVKDLEIAVVPINELSGKTLELIGSHVNGNPYGIGSKDNPFHLLVVHGSIDSYKLPEQIDYDSLKDWFQDAASGKVEGIVWHCENLKMFKIHRHHFGLPWPLKRPSEKMDKSLQPVLCRRKVHINSKVLQDYVSESFEQNSQFHIVKHLHGQTFDSLCAVPWTACW